MLAETADNDWLTLLATRWMDASEIGWIHRRSSSSSRRERVQAVHHHRWGTINRDRGTLPLPTLDLESFAMSPELVPHTWKMIDAVVGTIAARTALGGEMLTRQHQPSPAAQDLWDAQVLHRTAHAELTTLLSALRGHTARVDLRAETVTADTAAAPELAHRVDFAVLRHLVHVPTISVTPAGVHL